MRVEGEKEKGIAVDDGEGVRHLHVKGGFHRGLVEVDGDGGGFNADRFADGADFEFGVDGDVGAGLDEDVLLFVRPEARVADGKRLGAGGDEIEEVGAVGICIALDLDICVDVAEQDFCSGDDAAGGIGYDTAYRTAQFLSVHERAGQRQREYERKVSFHF